MEHSRSETAPLNSLFYQGSNAGHHDLVAILSQRGSSQIDVQRADGKQEILDLDDTSKRLHRRLSPRQASQRMTAALRREFTRVESASMMQEGALDWNTTTKAACLILNFVFLTAGGGQPLRTGAPSCVRV